MSKYLNQIIENQNQICDMQIVFIDIVKYSKRKTGRQVKLINSFTQLIKSAITETNRKHLETFQANNISLQSDSIIIPTGDGLAIGMPFPWIKTLHLDTALMVLNEISKLNQLNECKEFTKNGYCDCHNNLNVRIGISTGTVILYKDINSKYNIAGNPINMAARVMNCANNNQIVFTKEAFKLLDDLSTDSITFIEYKNKEIKHGLYIDLYQYVNNNIPYLNSDRSEAPIDHSEEEISSNKLSELVDLILVDKGSFIRQLDNKKILVSKGFAISKHTITQELYEKVCENNPSFFKSPSNPVENVTFLQALNFCNKLSTIEKYNENYSISSGTSIIYNSTTKGYRLPFEFEFDYMISALIEQDKVISNYKPWLNDNSKNKTHAIDSYSSNTFLVHDLIGNVWEWCFDNYIAEVKYNEYENNQVVVQNSKARVAKGGSYSDILTTLVNNNFRTKLMQEQKYKNCGFRIILQNIN